MDSTEAPRPISSPPLAPPARAPPSAGLLLSLRRSPRGWGWATARPRRPRAQAPAPAVPPRDCAGRAPKPPPWPILRGSSRRVAAGSSLESSTRMRPSPCAPAPAACPSPAPACALPPAGSTSARAPPPAELLLGHRRSWCRCGGPDGGAAAAPFYLGPTLPYKMALQLPFPAFDLGTCSNCTCYSLMLVNHRNSLRHTKFWCSEVSIVTSPIKAFEVTYLQEERLLTLIRLDEITR